MRVLLIPPIFHYKDAFPTLLSLSDFPSGFAYVASALEKAGHEVYGLNLNNKIHYKTAYDLVSEKIPKAIDKVKPDLIGLGGICTDYHFIRDTINIIRKTSEVPIVLGGGIITNDREIYNILKPDYAIMGEAETVIVKIANGECDKGIIEGYAENLDELPFPDYEPFGINEMMDEYSMATRILYRYSRQYPRPYNIVTARSCPFRCTFCIGETHKRNPYRARSMDNIFAEIKESYIQYRYNILIILDELFVANKKRMREFCERLIQEKKTNGWDFDWMFQTHANVHLDLDSLKLAKEAGCYFFSYGLESCSQRVLDSMNKKTSVSQAIEAVKLAEEAQIGFGGNIIFGDPAETEETISESLSVWYEHFRSAMVFLSFVQSYPGSKLFDDCLEKGIIPDRKTYYENINAGAFNMTTMLDSTLGGWMNLINMIERSWLQVKTVIGTYEIENEAPETKYLSETGTKMYRIKAVCPYCKKEIEYRQPLPPNSKEKGIGTGCANCNRRIKILIS